MSVNWLYFLIPNFIINLILAIWIKKEFSIFKKPKMIYNKNGILVDIHEEYKEFKRHDELSFLRLLIGLNILLFPKIIIFLIILFSYGVSLK
jgi:hypothetical protein